MAPEIPENPEDSNQRYHIRSVERALLVLQAFLPYERGASLSLTEISALTHLNLSTLFRFMVTLEAHKFVAFDQETNKYRLGVTCLELGNRFLRDNDLRKSSRPTLESLRNEFGETVHLAMLQGDEVVYLEKLDGLHPIGLMSSNVGGRAPAHCTGVGKALLAQLPESELNELLPGPKLARFTNSTITVLSELRKDLAQIRERGYATDCEEHEVGVKCVAAAIYDHLGPAAALSVSGPIDRIDAHLNGGDLASYVRRAADEISGKMGGSQVVRKERRAGDST